MSLLFFLAGGGWLSADTTISLKPTFARPGDTTILAITTDTCPTGSANFLDRYNVAVMDANGSPTSSLLGTQVQNTPCFASYVAIVPMPAPPVPAGTPFTIKVTNKAGTDIGKDVGNSPVFYILGPQVGAKLSPQTAQPGDTFNLVATMDGCPAGGKGLLDTDSVTVAGSEITLANPQVTDCSVSYKATVAAKPFNRELAVSVSSKGGTLGSFVFRIVDIAPGPTPPGINTQVDVMWGLMSDKTCSDQFGVRLARYYYCIGVTLGNNSGYPLILANVGFLHPTVTTQYRESTADYLSARAVIQHEQLYSSRNLTLKGLQAAGTVIAAFAPFTGNAGRKGRILNWSSIVGTALAGAWDSVVPDGTVREAGNLDDAALRGGRVIQNNSPTTFTVFVEREAIKQLLLRTPCQLDGDSKAAHDRAGWLRRQDVDAQDPAKRNDLEAQARGWDAEGDILADEASRRRMADATWRASMAAKKTSAREKGVDSTTNPDDKSHCGEDALLLQNSPLLKETKSHFNFLSRKTAPIEEDLLSVRRALGALIIVGDQIEYLQRVQVSSSAVVPGVGPSPEIQSVKGTVDPTGSPVDIVLTGKNLATATVKALKCSPTFSTSVDSSGTSITLKGFTVKDCTEASIPLQIDNRNGSTTYDLPVPQKPTLDDPGTVTTTKNGTATTAAFLLKGKNLTGAKPTITLKNGTSSQKFSDTDAPVTNATDTGLTATISVPADYQKDGTTADIAVATAAGTSNTVTVKVQPAAAAKPKPVKKAPVAPAATAAKK